MMTQLSPCRRQRVLVMSPTERAFMNVRLPRTQRMGYRQFVCLPSRDGEAFTFSGISTMTSRLTDAEIRAQIPAARAREAADRRKGLRALSARYDRKAQRVVVELTSGCLFAFPVRNISFLSAATPAQLAAVEVDLAGISLRWDALDVDLSVAGLLFSAIGEKEQRRQLASLAGRSKSAAKAKAARANGAKGGRPRAAT